MAALFGLLVLSRGLELSGYLSLVGAWLLRRLISERQLAVVLTLFAALLSMVVTNDVALFIVVPLTLGLMTLPQPVLGRLIVFQALAVNAGSAMSPIGNPQNLLLWQASGQGFWEFALMMWPIALVLLLITLLLIPLAFKARPLAVEAQRATPRHTPLFWLSLLLYLPFLLCLEWGLYWQAALAIALLYALWQPRLLASIDWSLLMVFVLMFIDLQLLASLPWVQAIAEPMLALPGGVLTASALSSQFLSNVPAAIFWLQFTDNWQALAWGVSLGGFGFILGSLANIIALRLAKQPGLWRDFHLWSFSVLLMGSIFLAASAYWRLLVH